MKLLFTEKVLTLRELPGFLEKVEEEPEEIQREIQVVEGKWVNEILLSIILGVKILDGTLSEQELWFTIKKRDGSSKRVKYVNIDSLQRITAFRMILDGRARVPKGTKTENPKTNEEVDISNMNIFDLDEKFPLIADEVRESQFKYIIYHNISKKTESWLFRKVTNNGIIPSPAEDRNAIRCEMARHCRKTGRKLIASDPHPLFIISEINGKKVANCFKKVPKKMAFDQEVARLIFWIIYGYGASSDHAQLIEMYEDPRFEDELILPAKSVLLNKSNVDLAQESLRMLDRLYKIFGDGQFRQEVGIITLRSAMLFLFALEEWEKAEGVIVTDLSDQFWKGHDSLCGLTPEEKALGTKRTQYDLNLSKITTASNVKENVNRWKQLIESEALENQN
jgi:hypothetical protein